MNRSIDWKIIESNHINWFDEQKEIPTAQQHLDFFISQIDAQASNEDVKVIEFQKWLHKNRYYETDYNGLHIQTQQHGTIGEPVKKTTQELLIMFNNEISNSN